MGWKRTPPHLPGWVAGDRQLNPKKDCSEVTSDWSFDPKGSNGVKLGTWFLLNVTARLSVARDKDERSCPALINGSEGYRCRFDDTGVKEEERGESLLRTSWSTMHPGQSIRPWSMTCTAVTRSSHQNGLLRRPGGGRLTGSERGSVDVTLSTLCPADFISVPSGARREWYIAKAGSTRNGNWKVSVRTLRSVCEEVNWTHIISLYAALNRYPRTLGGKRTEVRAERRTAGKG